MIITYHGAAMVKVSHGEWLAVFNPIGHSSEFKSSRFSADLAMVSLNDPAYNGLAEATPPERFCRAGFGGRKPFVIDGPGEYEVAGTFIRGFASPGPGAKINIIFDLALDGKRLVHLGALADPDLPTSVKEELVPVDILFVPIAGSPRSRSGEAGDELLSPRTAYQIALSLNPHLIVPVHYTPETLKQFLKEAGEEGLKTLDKLAVRGKELAENEAAVAVLEPI
ncbi:MAG: MBL fold metallo-hydrolase [Candidatus Vogelbacteria bacterium]|nr:MBL fold metallo-hydrolase [Candidatus Vogelbacteria bacterium]